MSPQISTDGCGFHGPLGDEFIVDPKRFQTRLLKDLVRDRMGEERVLSLCSPEWRPAGFKPSPPAGGLRTRARRWSRQISGACGERP